MRCAGAWLLACVCALLGPARAALYPHNQYHAASGVCSTLDIRNGAESLAKLRNCTVIEGSLSIVLFEKTNYSSFHGISFPRLREITGYFVMYRVRGLRSIGDLFPNLAVIRGQVLFKDFALVVFENEDMQTVGLTSLTNIERGAVRIERNNKLCYADSIDWSAIAPLSDNNIIRSNNYPPQCGLCPNEGDSSANAKHCPKNSYGRHLCWNSTVCQKVCPAECGSRACTSEGVCCDANCLGGCTGPRAEDCHVCRNLSISYGGGGRRCATICPPQTYRHYNRRCVSEQDCRNMPPPVGEESRALPFLRDRVTYKPFNETCTYDCPPGYVEGSDEKGLPTCKQCTGICVKHCSYDRIDSLESAQKFRGCTHLTGSLDISIRGGGNVMEELEQCLGMVQQIEGQLKVSRSYALVTLSFLKSLRRIRGQPSALNGPKQTLYVFDNPNLEELWDWKSHGDIVIEKGKLFVHFNPKLCYDQIKPLRRMAKDTTFDDLEVSTQSNGDKAACSREELKIWVRTITQSAVVLQWDQYCLPDQRQLLGYSIYYTKAPHNVTIYEKRNACQDIWTVEDLSTDSGNTTITLPASGKLPSDKERCRNLQPLFHILPHLDPYTRYAAYVKTYTTQADSKGAQSPIIYFSTLPGKPKPPRVIEIEPVSPNELNIKWQRPAVPNGNITTYHVVVELEDQHDVTTNTRNYCLQPPPSGVSKSSDEERRARRREEEKSREALDRACACDEGRPRSIFDDARMSEHDEAINFENDLQNSVYVKSQGPSKSQSRGRRSTDYSSASDPPPVKNITEGPYFRYISLRRPANVTELLVGRLQHYAPYKVSIWACRALHPSELINRTVANCSTSATKTMRTPLLEKADVISRVTAELQASNKSTPGVRVAWEPPAAPNGGRVLVYNIKQSRVENGVAMQTATTCVTSEELPNPSRGFSLRNLAPGNYSITVSAVTLAGIGPLSHEAIVFIPEREAEASREWWVGVFAGTVVAVALVGGAVWYARRSGLYSAPNDNKLFASVNPEYVGTVYEPDEWEVPRENIELLRELGQGSFGMVYEGIAKNISKEAPETRCAVKTVNEHATDRERVEFLNEASVMKAFDTFHVVRLLGVVSRGQPTLVVMELMERGDLKSYLRSHRPDQDNSASAPHGDPPKQPPTLQQIRQMAIEIADGMAYLSAKKFVHRDLAARNCMVAGDLTVKVGDFGMTRDIYETDYYRKGSKGLMPVRWMSPESLKDGVFSSSSDVWSFGVVLWEMATLAMQPYQGLSNEQVLRYVEEGGVMERPEHCPDGLYELMRRCWAHRPAARPTFMHIVSELAPNASSQFRHRSFFHSPCGQEYYAHQQNQEEEEQVEVQVGAVGADSGSNLFGVSGRIASWVRSSLARSRDDDDAASQPLAPLDRPAPHLKPAPPPAPLGPNGVVSQARYSREPAHDC